MSSVSAKMATIIFSLIFIFFCPLIGLWKPSYLILLVPFLFSTYILFLARYRTTDEESVDGGSRTFLIQNSTVVSAENGQTVWMTSANHHLPFNCDDANTSTLPSYFEVMGAELKTPKEESPPPTYLEAVRKNTDDSQFVFI